ncbi:aminotransferase-like domain-containing protein [Azohydromonas caseinilytica]|uniref:PLP-dependent aminotransferase family protein n=1 Tax=Azohydromonas caseinilytica TaxID=2728836 RepID=A0A848F4T8_9BURK|nr:PLP-dependent aminotransferase family protein [Azohydromonas caseinilytica]NML14098.1 PLP-dependent aminotransferase family protein [Azohydromonas caseinilytica]
MTTATSLYPLSTRAAALRSSDVRELLKAAQRADVISLAGGLPAAELFDAEGLRAATRAALETPAAALQYGLTEGQPALRAALEARERSHGIALAGRSLLVTTGSQQALDIVARLLLDEGDVVVVQRPSYLAALQTFALAGAQCVGLEEDEDGARVEDLETLAFARKPKLIYLVTPFANPSGASLSLRRRQWLLDWAARHQVLVLEDDPYGVLRTEGEAPPSLMALAQDVPGAAAWCGRTSTLSKAVAPGLRLGWLLLPQALAEAAARVKQALDLHTSSFAQEVAAQYLAGDRLEAHLQRVRGAYRERRRALCEALHAAFGDALVFSEPEGGMFVWARFTDGTDTRVLLPRALAAGMAYVPGDAFYADAAPRDRLRLSFTTEPPARLREGVARLHAAWQATRGA